MKKLFLSVLQENSLFADLTDEQIARLKPLLTTLRFNAGDIILREGSAPVELYVIVAGEVEVLKKDSSSAQEHRISTLRAGAVIGELALIDNNTRSASIRCLKETTVIAIAIEDLKKLTEHPASELPVYYKIIINLARELAGRLRHSNESIVRALTSELKLEKNRALIGRLIISLILIISFYTFALNIISNLAHTFPSPTFIGVPIITFCACVTFFFMRSNALPLSYYGLTLNRWRESIYEGVIYTLPILLFIVIAKYIAIKTIPALAELPLLEFTAGLNTHLSDADYPWLLNLLPFLYCLLVPIQELLYRGALQGPLEEFFIGRHKKWLAILASNFIFSLTHLHISFGLSAAVFLPGLFWGWLYARHRNLIGVIISHIMVGAWAFFIVGISGLSQL